MKKFTVMLFLLVANQQLSFASEGFMCNSYHKHVTRKVNNINRKGNSLSDIAKQQLYADLIFDTKQCISECEGKKFDYCNKVAKDIENNR